ncbi:MAG: hypothetical protein B7Z08_06280 [Sphingomonadales bacterium 32-68-7]|nr:MAG: hypothetical protein B7Z33_08195 [Sphingomonadales bacterium 12-68-11]OYX09208.1 MAG: hypothetical protein B7Z08_06280 [Sphingomonadales bacterium 32-68-7]
MSLDRSRYLLISRIGGNSLHEQWLRPAAARNFDVLLSSYDRSVVPPAAGVRFEYRAGAKVSGYAAILREHAQLIASYDYVALFDDDLAADAVTISGLFETCARYDLKIAQPALDHASFFTYACMLEHKGFLLRYTTQVEMMCPVFRSDILLSLAPLFELGFESGIDLIWSGLVHEHPRDLAVIDAYPVRHTRRVSLLKEANGFEGTSYGRDIRSILALFDAPWLPCLNYGGIRRGGRSTESRIRLAAAAATVLLAVPRHLPMRWRLRSVAVYFNHLRRWAPRNVRLAWPPERARGADSLEQSSPRVL